MDIPTTISGVVRCIIYAGFMGPDIIGVAGIFAAGVGVKYEEEVNVTVVIAGIRIAVGAVVVVQAVIYERVG
jgi:hypothetical protein